MLFCKKYYIVLDIGSENKQMWVLPLIPRAYREIGGGVYMLDFLIFLIIGFMISITINVALLSVIYIILSNKQQ